MQVKNFFGVFLVLLLISSALLLQNFYHLIPCPLCIMQRIAFIAIAIIFFIFAILPQRYSAVRLQGFLLLLFSGAGLAIAIRQIYLQHLPADKIPSCGPGFDYLFQILSWHQALDMVFKGSGECAKVDWHFAGLSMASWAALWFLFFFGWALKLLIKVRD